MQAGLVLVDVMGVVGSHKGELEVFAEAQQPLIYLIQPRHMVVLLEFEEIAVAEQLAIPAGGSGRFVVVTVG